MSAAEASPLHSHSLPLFAAVCYAQLLRLAHYIRWRYQGAPILRQQSIQSNTLAAPPHRQNGHLGISRGGTSFPTPISSVSWLTGHLFIHNLLESFASVIWNWPLFVEGRQRQKKEADHYRLAGGRFDKQGNWFSTSLGLGQDVVSLTCLPNSKVIWRP